MTAPGPDRWSDTDRAFMRRALALAARGDHRVGTNPKVGAVLARGGRSLAEGFHTQSGGPHAEAAALAALADAGDARGATLYVTLEPCGAFEGKRTPPCLEAVLEAEVARVVVAQEDPHPGVSGRSLERLRAAGVTVEVGLLGEQARALNGSYRKWIAHRRPYVTAKWAMTLDGKIACGSGHSRWISGERSRRAVHRLRGEVDAIAVGIGTALADDPLLTRRDVPGHDPLRVVVDSRARLPLAAKLVETAQETPLLLATTESADAERLATLRQAGVEVAVLPARAERVDPEALMQALADREVRHLLVEGGAELLGGLFAADLVDRVIAFIAPRVLGGAGALTPVGGIGAERVEEGPRLHQVRWRTSGEDLCLEGHIHVY